MTDDSFELATARHYWRYAPSGKGKVDTAELIGLPDDAFLAIWQEHFRSRLTYYWEDEHVVAHFADLFRGRSVLSFGSGIGHNEMQFMRAGATLTCVDIVPSNLATIARAAGLLGLGDRLTTIDVGTTPDAPFGGPYDFVFARGSLMHMPLPLQAQTMARFRRALRPGGMIILNLYTRAFAAAVQGLDSPVAFGRRSDPSVQGMHCPWADWHDDGKLRSLAGPEMFISHKQVWNQGYYVWYGLSWSEMGAGENAAGTPIPFVDLDALDLPAPLATVPPDDFALAEAGHDSERAGDGGLALVTGENNYLYAAISTERSGAALAGGPVMLTVDATLDEGGFSVSLLDCREDRMTMARPITWPGRHRHVFSVPDDAVVPRFKIVLSNHCDGAPARSRFVVHDLSFRPKPPPRA